jgi:hypothetical protein
VSRWIIFLLAFGLIVCQTASAQKFHGGLVTGLNISTQHFSGTSIPTATTAGAGFHAGVYTYSMFNDRLGMQAEVLFSIQNIGLDYSVTKYDDRLTYINVPILLRYKVREKLSAHAGFQLGLLSSANEESGGFSYDTRSAFTNADLGFVIGGTVDLPLHLNATLRYVFGITDVDKFADTTTQNGNFQVSIGYRIFGAP